MEWLGLSGVMAAFLGLTLAIYGIFVNGRNTKRLIADGAERTERVSREVAERTERLIAEGAERTERLIVEEAQNTRTLIAEGAERTERILERISALIASEGEKTRAEIHRGKG